MTVNITVPPFPESVEEGTLSAWHKKQGEAVQKNEKVADIETDKIVLEVMAQAAGRLLDSWRTFHRVLALLFLVALATHIGAAIYYGFARI